MQSGFVYEDLLPFSEAGTYKLFAGGGGASVEDEVDFCWDWAIDIEVAKASPVPEPATILFLSIGIAGLVGTSLRKKKK